MPLTVANINPINPAATHMPGGTRSSRGRGGRGRPNSSNAGSRRGDYNNTRMLPADGSPASISSQTHANTQTLDQQGQLMLQQQPQQQHPHHHHHHHQQQQQIDNGQLIVSPPHAYPAVPHQSQFIPPHMQYYQLIHPAHAPAIPPAAAGQPLYMQSYLYNTGPVYNCMGGYFIQQPPMNPVLDYQYMTNEDGSIQGDERQGTDVVMQQPHQMWHAQQMYAGEEYVMQPAEMHGMPDDMNQNAVETPGMLSPNYPIYDQQIHEMQQQMDVIHIYDDPQASLQNVAGAGMVPQVIITIHN